MAQKIYGLIVGINKYPTINQLSGAVADAQAMYRFLMEKYRDWSPDILMLTDEQATRAKIIDAFRTHLAKAGAGDTAFFHFSGHGSREQSPEEFRIFFPEGKNETLVCYDSRSAGSFDLADKELAVLLHELDRNSPHIVVSLDCCHSGSGTRKSIKQVTPRQAERDGNTRPLESYLDGYFSDMLRRENKITIPPSRHILLSACRNTELAWERVGNQGVFTSTLLETLEATDIQISYAELFTKVSLKIQKDTNQHPQFEVYGGANAYDMFMTGSPMASMVKLKVFYDTLKGDCWKINSGALQGMPVDHTQPITLQIYNEAQQPVAKAEVSTINQNDSKITVTEGDIDTSIIYEANFTSIPELKIPIYLSSLPDNFSHIIPSALFEVVDEEEQGIYMLELTGSSGKEQYRIIHRLSNKIITESSNSAYVNECLVKIARWETLRRLRNSKTKFNPSDLDIQFDLLAGENSRQSTRLSGNELSFNIRKGADGNDELYWYELFAENKTPRDLYVALLAISSLYGIYHVNYKKIPAGQRAIMSFEDRSDFLSFSPEEKDDIESIILFKFIASTQEINTTPLIQNDFSENRSRKHDTRASKSAGEELQDRFGRALKRGSIVSQEDDWFTQDLTLRLVREESQVGSQKEVTLSNGLIKIKPHGYLKASVNFGQVNPSSRDAANRDAIFAQTALDKGLPLFNLLGKSRSTQPAELLELSDIQGDVSMEQPLQIEISAGLGADEILLPVTFDGEDLLVVGSSYTDTNGQTQIAIHELPEEQQNAKSRNIGRAIKLCFFKLALRKAPDDLFLLRWVDYSNGKPERRTDNLAEKVASAKNIILAVHGIIGDTENIITFLQPLTHTHKADGYDLVLSFDYENLNTPIGEIAQHLKKQLMDVGFKENDQKELTILSHSMGGLVSRYLIEREDGGKWINKLIMAGTPNGGSPFGEVPGYLQLVKTILTVGLGSAFFAPYLAWAGGLIVALEKSKDLTITLSQMKPNSDFMRELSAAGDPHVRYYAIAGDITHYEQQSDKAIARMMEKMLLRFGNFFSGKDANDIAVKTDDILRINVHREPAPVFERVPCHHLNYFEHEAGVAALMKVL